MIVKLLNAMYRRAEARGHMEIVSLNRCGLGSGLVQKGNPRGANAVLPDCGRRLEKR